MDSFNYNNKNYKIIIIKKNNKNTYIRVDDNFNIIVTTSYFTPKKLIIELIKKNEDQIIKMINQRENKLKKEQTNDYHIKIFDNNYDITYCNIFNKLEIENNKIYCKDISMLNKYLISVIKNTYQKHLEINYNKIESKIPYPNLKIRKMKTRWGVCNYKTKTITLNSELIHYDIKYLDYVIIHELVHLIYPNHSKLFWNEVQKYEPNYKELRKGLKS